MTTSSVPPSRWKRIWCGRDGLRSGWAVALFFVILIIAVVVLGYIARMLHLPMAHGKSITPIQMILSEVVFCISALIATVIMGRIDKRSWSNYGLRARHGAIRFGQGAFWGVIIVAAIMAVLYLTHAATITFSGAGAWTLLKSGVLWAVAFCLVAGSEELTFRGFPFFRLARGWNPVAAAIVASLLFGCAHLSNHGENVMGITTAVSFGLVACLAVWRTGSLWWVFGLHAAWDWSETFLFGTADSGLVAPGHLLTSHAIGPTWLSGGSVGPEGSVIIFPAMAVLALVIVWTVPRATAKPDATRDAVRDEPAS